MTLLFTTETEKQMDEVISLYSSGEKPTFPYTRK